MPSASPEELAAAISDAIGAGAKVINLSAALVQSIIAWRARVAAGFELCGPAQSIGGRSGRKPGDGRQLRHHAPSLGDSSYGLRLCRAGPRRSRTWAVRSAGGDWPRQGKTLPV